MSLAVSLAALVAPLIALDKSMWRDEGATMFSVHLPWSELWQQSHVVDRVLLFYYSVIHAWIAVSGSIEWVRLLSVMAFGFTVYLSGRIGDRLGGVWCAAVGAVAVGANPLLINSAVQARPYALATLGATAAAYCLFRWRDDGGTRWTWLFAAACIATMLFQFFILMAPLAVLAAVAVTTPRPRQRQWRQLLAPTAVVVLVAVGYLALVAGQQSQVAWITRQSPVEAVLEVSGLAVIGHHLVYAVVVTLSALIGLAVAGLRWASGRRLEPRLVADLFICLAWMVAPPVALEVFSLHKPTFVDRYVTASVVGMGLVLGILASDALRGVTFGPRRAGWAKVVGGLLAALLFFESHVSASAVEENFRGVAVYVASHLTSGVVALPDHSLTEGVGYYWPSSRGAIPLWPQLRNQIYIEGLDLQESRATFAAAPRDVWVVQDQSVRVERRFLAELSRHGYVVVGRHRVVAHEIVEIIHFHR